MTLVHNFFRLMRLHRTLIVAVRLYVNLRTGKGKREIYEPVHQKLDIIYYSSSTPYRFCVNFFQVDSTDRRNACLESPPLPPPPLSRAHRPLTFAASSRRRGRGGGEGGGRSLLLGLLRIPPFPLSLGGTGGQSRLRLSFFFLAPRCSLALSKVSGAA